ncbi:unnamed protein product [Amaranthus hypochondriacus]
MSKVIFLVALMVVLVVSPVLAQESVDVPDCVDQLDKPCGPFVNSTTAQPPAECCQPLGMVIRNDVQCLCTIFSSDEIIQTLSLNVTEALTLPMRCGFQFDLLSACQALAEGPATAPASVLSQVGAASKLSNIASTGSVLLGSFFLWVTLMFN